MSLSAIPKSIRVAVFQRDEGRCRYCRLAQLGQASVFHINHIVPRSKGGQTEETNLALQCPYCSLHKSDKTVANDPVSGELSPLFHPLKQKWDEHFSIDSNGICRGLTPTGRATVDALHMNDTLPTVARVMQIRAGLLMASK
ncbi:MAG TPA: HNH endonuclease signature motif containing protein [Tepidisphaeraceae bacterium]|nr:HNH endonuclease signature motif containing protein [Tepidisphaeraceae bacterium]